jgi:hypothetical protein
VKPALAYPQGQQDMLVKSLRDALAPAGLNGSQ